MSRKSDILKEVPQLNTIINSMKKKFGEHSIIWYGESVNSFSEYDVMETGIFGLDDILGNCGIVKGRIMELFGPESSGKTTEMLKLIAQAQKLGGVCAYIDAEHALDPVYASNCGVDLNSLLISQPDSAEEVLEIAENLCAAGCIDIVVIDSIGGLVTKEEIEKGPSDSSVGALSKILTPSLKRMCSSISNTNTILCVINQIRDKISIGWGGGGGGTTTPGGRYLKFVASYRLEIKKTGQVKRGDTLLGITSEIKAVKNKCSAPFKSYEIEILFHEKEGIWGIWEAADIYKIGDKLGIFEGKVAKKFNGESIGTGVFDIKMNIHNNLELKESICKKIREILGYSDFPRNFRDNLSNIEKSEKVTRKRLTPEPKHQKKDSEKSEADLIAEIQALMGAGTLSEEDSSKAEELLKAELANIGDINIEIPEIEDVKIDE